MDPLASSEDVEAQLGRELTDAESGRVDDILAKASALFRDKSGQDFTPGRSVRRLKVNGGRVRLPQTPVVEVHSVTLDDGAPVDHDLFGQWLTVPLASHEFVRVDYEHGGDVPDLVRITIAEVVAKVIRIDRNAAAGVATHQLSAGQYQESRTYAGWALGGGTSLAPEDEKVALSFRYKGSQVVVQQP